MAPFLGVRSRRRRAEPHLVIESIGNRHDRLRIYPVDRILDARRFEPRTDAYFHSLQTADPLVADKLTRKSKVVRRSLPAPGLPDTIVPIHLVDNRPTLGNRQRQGFFAVDVLARTNARNRKGRMPMVRNGYAKRINIGASEQVSKIVVPSAVVISVMNVKLSPHRACEERQRHRRRRFDNPLPAGIL